MEKWLLTNIKQNNDLRHPAPQRAKVTFGRKNSGMQIIFFLIGISLLVAGGFLAAFFWAVRSGQYDDDFTPSIRILFDDKKKTSDNYDNE